MTPNDLDPKMNKDKRAPFTRGDAMRAHVLLSRIAEIPHGDPPISARKPRPGSRVFTISPLPGDPRARREAKIDPGEARAHGAIRPCPAAGTTVEVDARPRSQCSQPAFVPAAHPPDGDDATGSSPNGPASRSQSSTSSQTFSHHQFLKTRSRSLTRSIRYAGTARKCDDGSAKVSGTCPRHRRPVELV